MIFRFRKFHRDFDNKTTVGLNLPYTFSHSPLANPEYADNYTGLVRNCNNCKRLVGVDHCNKFCKSEDDTENLLYIGTGYKCELWELK
jgi:hypothetical protein